MKTLGPGYSPVAHMRTTVIGDPGGYVTRFGTGLLNRGGGDMRPEVKDLTSQRRESVGIEDDPRPRGCEMMSACPGVLVKTA